MKNVLIINDWNDTLYLLKDGKMTDYYYHRKHRHFYNIPSFYHFPLLSKKPTLFTYLFNLFSNLKSKL